MMSDREQSREKERTWIAGCRREVLDRGWCKRHLVNWRRTGDPERCWCAGRRRHESTGRGRSNHPHSCHT